MIFKKCLSATALAALSLSAIAEDSKPLEADVELGFISTTGNTESESLIGKANIKQNLSKWRNTYILETLQKKDTIEDEDTGEDEKTTTAQRFFASGQADLKLDDKYKAVFFYGSYEDDKFSGYEYQGTLSIGYTDRLFENAKSSLDYGIGPGVAFTKTEETDEVESIEDESLIVRVSLEYLYQISENAKFTQTLSSDVAAESNANTKTKSESAITANLNSSLALKASFLVNHNSEVGEDVEKTDTQTAVTLVYTF